MDEKLRVNIFLSQLKELLLNHRALFYIETEDVGTFSERQIIVIDLLEGPDIDVGGYLDADKCEEIIQKGQTTKCV